MEQIDMEQEQQSEKLMTAWKHVIRQATHFKGKRIIPKLTYTFKRQSELSHSKT